MSLRRYVPSGRGGPGAIPAVLAASLLAGVILGVIEGLVSQWLSLFLLFPLFIGIAAGAAAAGMTTRFKLRAPALVLLLGFAGGAAGYVAEHVTVYFHFRSELAAAIKQDQPAASDADISAKIDELLTQEVGAPGFRGFLLSSAREGVQVKRMSSRDDDGLSFKGTAAWILWAIELLGAAAVAAGVAWSKARAPFCEDCDAWYGPAAPVARVGAGGKAMQRQLLAALDIGDLDGAARAFYGAHDPKSRAIFELTAASCPICSGDAYCQLDRVVLRKRAQRSKIATWLMHRPELSQLSAALQRANSSGR
jgi:hypothetical protein